MATSVDGIRENLQGVEEELKATEQALIDALEGGAKLKAVEEIEENIVALVKKRKDLKDTIQFVIQRERERTVRDSKPLSTVYYVSQWSKDLSPSEDIPSLSLTANAKNEARGITGVLFVLRGWFASYLEGEDSALESSIATIASDKRHNNFAILKRERNLPPSTARRFPSSGLKVHWLNSPSTSTHDTGPQETAIIHYLCQQLALVAYIPRSVLSIEEHHAMRAAGVALDEVTQTIQRRSEGSSAAVHEHYIVSVSPFSEKFWENPLATDHIQNLYTVAKEVWERPSEGAFLVSCGAHLPSSHPTHYLGSILGPHTAERLLVASGRFAEESLLRTQKFINELERQFPETMTAYQPTVALHSGEVQTPLNGRITVVGSMLRYLRDLSTVAQEEGLTIVCSDKVADEAQRIGVSSVGFFPFEKKRPDEVFAPTAHAKRRWESRPKVTVAATVLGAAEEEGGVPQVISEGKKAAKTSKPDDLPLTNDELNAQPPRGFIDEADIRRAFDGLNPDPETDTIPLDVYAAYYQGADHMGVQEAVFEMDSHLMQFEPARKSRLEGTLGGQNKHKRRVNFDQFAMLWYRGMNS